MIAQTVRGRLDGKLLSVFVVGKWRPVYHYSRLPKNPETVSTRVLMQAQRSILLNTRGQLFVTAINMGE